MKFTADLGILGALGAMRGLSAWKLFIGHVNISGENISTFSKMKKIRTHQKSASL